MRTIIRGSDDPVQQDDDLHDAVCGALAKLKVMRRRGPNHYVFRRLKSLPSNVRQLIDRYRQLIPDKYFPKTQTSAVGCNRTERIPDLTIACTGVADPGGIKSKGHWR